jgi:GTP-binding protein
VLDATAGVTAQDKKIAGLIHAARKPCVVTLNKWDLVREQTADKESLSQFLDHIRAQLFFLDYAPVLLASAKTGAEMTRIFKTIERVHRESQTRIGTGPLNRLFAEAIARHPAPIQSGRRFKLLYATQAETRTRSPIPIPELVLFCNDEKLLPENYRKYLDAQIRDAHPFTGIPILFHLRARDPKASGNGSNRRKKTVKPSEPPKRNLED